MTGHEAAELVAWAKRRAALQPTGPPPEGAQMHEAMFRAMTRVLARRMVVQNREVEWHA